MIDAVTTTALPLRLRDATRELHAAAERSPLMRALIAGRLARADYVALLRNLHLLYDALEAGLAAAAAHPVVATLDAAPLARRAALAQDLDTLAPGWRAQPCAPAATAYAERLRAAPPPVLAAHAYVRYLGDLHGGQLLARQVARALGTDAALAFYDFGPESRVLALRAQLRSALGRLPLGAHEADTLVAEACWGFEQHRRLFDELAPAPA